MNATMHIVESSKFEVDASRLERNSRSFTFDITNEYRDKLTIFIEDLDDAYKLQEAATKLVRMIDLTTCDECGEIANLEAVNNHGNLCEKCNPNKRGE